MPLTPKEEALKKEREQRMQDRQTIELHPWRARFEALDHAGKVAVDATIPLAAWVAMTYGAWDYSWWTLAIAFFVGAAQFFYRYAVYRATGSAVVHTARLARGAVEASRERRRKAAHAVHAQQKLQEQLAQPRDIIDGVPIDTIAASIAASPDTPIQKTLESLDFSTVRANDIRRRLLAARFLIWPYTITDTTYALGDAPMAIPDNSNGRATILNPALTSATADERQALVGNALKRTEGITPDADPCIRGELTANDRNLMGRMVKYVQDTPPPKTA